jgi:tetratricopeptide (TPR) repeat protein
MVTAATQAFGMVFCVFVALLVIAWPAYRVLSLLLMKELTAAEACGAWAVLLAFLLGIMRTWGQPLNVLLWVLLIALAAFIWIGGKAHDRVRLDRFFQEDVAASHRALAKDPENGAAHMRLGVLYERRGDLDPAIHHYEEACRISPRDGEARLALANAVERHRREVLGNLVCWKCGMENAKTASHCRECGALISDRNEVIGFLTESTFGKAIPWLALAALALAVGGSLLRGIPAALTVLGYLLLFAAAMYYVYPRWARARLTHQRRSHQRL